MAGLAKTKKGIANILRYTEELLSFNEKVIFDLAREPYPHFFESQVARLEGVDTGVDDDAWLRLHRLREAPPPAPDQMFEAWFDAGSHLSPDHPPRLLSERLLNLPVEEISDLIEAGIVVDENDVMRPLDVEEARPLRMDVLLRVATMPEFARLWQEYLDGPWAAWAGAERPRRRSIDFYNKVYQIHQRIQSMGEDTPIELVFGIGMARWQHPDERINVPLLEQLVEIELEETGDVTIRPRQSQPHLALRPFHTLEIEGSKGVQRDVGEQFERILDDPDKSFSPFEKKSFETILRACAARLSSSGIYHPDTLKDPADRSLPSIDDKLRVTDTWVLFVRQRNDDFRREDLRRLAKKVEAVENDEELPSPGKKFVEEPSNTPTGNSEDMIDLTSGTLTFPEARSGWSPSTGGANSSTTSSQAGEDAVYFFPLPFNDDQKEIIRRLEDQTTDGVLVQGPPGTGKTHTIANVICHYLATQRRVLVTAKTPEALTALQEKLPDGISDLAIAVIHNDREGARQLEHAVRILADEAKSISPRLVQDQIREKQLRLKYLRDAVAKIDRQLYGYAERNLATLKYAGDELVPMDVARAVAAEREEHCWFEDMLDSSRQFEPQFAEPELEEVRRLRRALADVLDYEVATLPDPADLPDLPKILAAHHELGRLKAIVARSQSGEIPFMTLEGGVDIDGARRAETWMRSFAALMSNIENEQWLFEVYHMLIGLKRPDEQTMATVKSSLGVWLNLYSRGRDYSLKGIVISGPEADKAFDKALEDLAAGKKPFGVFSFLKSALKAKIDSVRLEGRAPADAADWSVVHNYRSWQQQVLAFLGRWSGVARAIGAPVLPSEWAAAEAEILRLGRFVEQVWAIHEEVDAHRKTLRALFPYGLDLDEALHHGRCEKVVEALAANLEKAELADAHAITNGALGVARDVPLPFHAALRDVCANLGDADVPPTAITEAWQEIQTQAHHLHSYRSDLARLDALVELVAKSGAPKWATKLRNVPPDGETDQWT